MKIHCAIISAVCLLAISLTAGAAPKVKWVETIHDFGAFDESMEKVTTVFKGVNVGDEPMLITGARANCGCTTPTYTMEVIQPGDTAFVSVTYNADGRPGRFNKKVYVDTNTNPVRSVLTIKGVVIGKGETISQRYPVSMGALKVTRPSVLLGKAAKGHATTVFMNGYNQSADSIGVTAIDTPDWLSVKATPEKAGPGELVQLSFFVRPDKTDLYGLVTDTIAIRVCPDGKECTEHKLPVVVTFSEDFSGISDQELALSPLARLSVDRLDFGDVEKGVKVTKSVELVNAGKKALNVRRVYSGDSGITAKVVDKVVKPGKKTRIDITILPDTDIINGRVTIITNDPLNSVQTLRVTGTTH